MVWSNAFDADGTRLGGNRRYKNPNYYPYRTEEQVVAQLEDLTQQRAGALEAQRRKEGEVDPSRKGQEGE
jgi:hypothetical protein